MQAADKLSFAYRYPFTEVAKELVGKYDTSGEAFQYLKQAKARIEEALSKKAITYKSIAFGQKDSIISYAYTRMLMSALPQHLLRLYAIAEARRSCAAMGVDSDPNVVQLLKELGMEATPGNGGFSLDVITFLRCGVLSVEDSLVNQRLAKGMVELTRHELSSIMVGPVGEAIAKGLPISRKELPKQVVEYAPLVVLPKEEAGAVRQSNTIHWIDRLLATPIPDVRQRVVGLLLAPYLINVKGMDVDSACRVISDYIEKCKALDPATQVTSAKIRYYCSYAKLKGKHPMSLKRAEEFLSGVIDIASLNGRMHG